MKKYTSTILGSAIAVLFWSAVDLDLGIEHTARMFWVFIIVTIGTVWYLVYRVRST